MAFGCNGQDSEELAAFNVEALETISVLDGEVMVDMAWNGTAGNYRYPISSGFRFEPRKSGTGTANENITAPKWNVYYSNNNLYFSETVNNVMVYAIHGALVAGFYGIYTEVPVNLHQGIYIVRAGNNTAKLLVNGSGFGSAAVQEQVQTRAAVYADPTEISTRAESVIRIYWNIRSDGTTVPIEISDVEKFYFTADNAVVFTLKNGNTVELANYKDMEFSIEPAQLTTNSKWDLEKTLQFGGASYWYEYPSYIGEDYSYMCVIAVALDHVAVEFMPNDIWNGNIKFFRKDIKYADFWDTSGKLSVAFFEVKPKLTIAIDQFEPLGRFWYHFAYDQTGTDSYAGIGGKTLYELNGGTPFISTVIRLNADDSLTMEFTDVATDEVYTHTFPAP